MGECSRQGVLKWKSNTTSSIVGAINNATGVAGHSPLMVYISALFLPLRQVY